MNATNIIGAGRRANERAGLWVAKAVTGMLIFTILMVHLVVNHLVAEGGLMSYAAVVAYMSKPWVLAMEMIFLVLVVTHSLLGVRGIILDLQPSAAFVRLADLALLVLGI